MKFRVEFSATAWEEIQAAFSWLANHSPAAAERWKQAILSAVESLERFPERCSLAAESETQGREIRQLLHGRREGRYRILYEIHGAVVYIVHVRHAARDVIDEE